MENKLVVPKSSTIIPISEADLGLLHKALHLGCCSTPRSASEYILSSVMGKSFMENKLVVPKSSISIDKLLQKFL